MADYDELDPRTSFTEKFLDHINNPRNVGDIRNADGYAEDSGECHDTMAVSVKICENKVEDAGFWTDGCGATIACGSVVTELAKNRPISEAMKISASDIIAALGDIPPENVHCAILAAGTLQKALKDYCGKNRILCT